MSSSSLSSSPSPLLSPTPPLLVFGIISDIQCADFPDGHNYTHTEIRYYRHSLLASKRAAQEWKKRSLPFAIHCGDLIDGIAKRQEGKVMSDDEKNEVKIKLKEMEKETFMNSNADTQSPNPTQSNPHLHPTSPSISTISRSRYTSNDMIDMALSILPPADSVNIPMNAPPSSLSSSPSSSSYIPVFHIMGNHELYNNDRQSNMERFNIPQYTQQRMRMDYSKNDDSHQGIWDKKYWNEEDRKYFEENIIKNYLFQPWDNTHPFQTQKNDHSISSTSSPPYDISTSSYYSIHPHPNIHIIFLDSYDISLLGRSAPHPYYQVANSFLLTHNHSEDLNAPPCNDKQSVERRFVKFNGGVSIVQLHWLYQMLLSCRQSNSKCLLISHVPFHPQSCDPIALVWNYSDVLSVIERFEDVVIGCFFGHDHDGGRWRGRGKKQAENEEGKDESQQGSVLVDSFGISYHTLEATLLTPPGRDTFGRVELYSDRMEIIGTDMMKSFTVPLQHKIIN